MPFEREKIEGTNYFCRLLREQISDEIRGRDAYMILGDEANIAYDSDKSKREKILSTLASIASQETNHKEKLEKLHNEVCSGY